MLRGTLWKETPMVTHSLRHPSSSGTTFLDWVLILTGALVAWLFWPDFRS